MKRETVFLTCREAIDSVLNDFRRYDPQIMLFCEVIRLVSGGKIITKRDGRQGCVWVGLPGKRNMRRFNGPEMLEYVCRVVSDAEPDGEILAALCTMVFHTRAYTEVDPEDGRKGISVETGMEDFSCRQCGECCRSLDYHKDITREDISYWKSLGREDILKWVGAFEMDNGEKVYSIWTVPGTMKFAEVCPFLKEVSSENRSVCLIHDVKPAICRQYPLSKKHAVMTGCRGFEDGPVLRKPL